MTGAGIGEKTVSLGHQEPIGGNAERGVVVKTAPAPSFEMAQPQFLFQFLVIALDNPTLFSQSHQIPQLGWRRPSGKPVFGRLALAA
jgi:hypothetical protein